MKIFKLPDSPAGARDSQSLEVLQQFRSEAVLMSGLDHPNVVKLVKRIFHYMTTPHFLYLHTYIHTPFSTLHIRSGCVSIPSLWCLSTCPMARSMITCRRMRISPGPHGYPLHWMWLMVLALHHYDDSFVTVIYYQACFFCILRSRP